jgi:MerR family transcriptional regulator, heat shock protein HspR
MSPDFADDRALFGMSVAADLTGVHPQMLRAYEAKGLVTPYRTDGGTRRYSGNDITRIQRITELLASGLNLEGVQQVLRLEEETQQLKGQLAELRKSAQSRSAPGEGYSVSGKGGRVDG